METIFKFTMDEENDDLLSQHISSLADHNTHTSTSSTCLLLQDCLSIIQAPNINNNTITSKTNTNLDNNRSTAYDNHPDIQYFQKIKSKNHFNYHKSKHQTKWNIDKVSSGTTTTTTADTKMTEFEPYNLDLLLNRIKSFNSLNWKTIDPNINELKCALNGWKCVSFGIKESKNHLICTFCNQQLILKYDDVSSNNNTLEGTVDITPFDYNAMSGNLYDENFHKKLVELYTKQIENTGHGNNCLWRNFETPIEGIYYLRQYLPDNNQFLINQYCKNLKNLIDNLLILQEYSSEYFNPDFLKQQDHQHHEIDESFVHSEFIRIANQWLLSKYFNDNKENFQNGVISYQIPAWIYKLAIYGWSLNVQTYARDVILVMSCNMCNERVFLNSNDCPHASSSTSATSATSTTGTTINNHQLNLSLSKILTPVVYPMLNSHGGHNGDGVGDEYDTIIEDNKFDPRFHHKSWCSYLHNNLPKYFIEMLLESELNIGANGEYIYDNDLMNIDTTGFTSNSSGEFVDDNVRKRRKSFTVNEGLERLHKLRRLYLIDE